MSCMMILFACGGKKTQTENADAATVDSTLVMTSEKTDSIPNTPIPNLFYEKLLCFSTYLY